MELFNQAADSVAVEGGVEVHGALYDEDNGDDGPFLPGRIGEASLVISFFLSELVLVFEVRIG